MASQFKFRASKHTEAGPTFTGKARLALEVAITPAAGRFLEDCLSARAFLAECCERETCCENSSGRLEQGKGKAKDVSPLWLERHRSEYGTDCL
jgi:hypothetical protein